MSRDPFDLTGRTALVTGGSKGIGKAIAGGLARAGARVLIASRHEDELAASAAEIGAQTGAEVAYRVADMTHREDVDRLARHATETLGAVDILFNNAGTNAPQSLDEITDEVWDRIVELNLTSCVLLARALAPGMKARGWGRIVYLASIMGIVGAEGRSVYCATKGALISLAHAQAVELGPHGVTVNCISPGPVFTDLPRTKLSEEQQQIFAQRTALGRWAQTEELVGPALLLASDAGSYITGANLVVDGGCTVKAF